MMAEYKDRLSANGILHPDAGIIGGDARSLDMARGCFTGFTGP